MGNILQWVLRNEVGRLVDFYTSNISRNLFTSYDRSGTDLFIKCAEIFKFKDWKVVGRVDYSNVMWSYLTI